MRQLGTRLGFDLVDQTIEDVVEQSHMLLVEQARAGHGGPGEGTEPTPIERRLGAEDTGFDIAEHRVLLDAVLADLTERERTIVELRVFQDKTQTEIAEEVGISQMHVSRLLSRSLDALRRDLEQS